jgi:hypothetical protein
MLGSQQAIVKVSDSKPGDSTAPAVSSAEPLYGLRSGSGWAATATAALLKDNTSTMREDNFM